MSILPALREVRDELELLGISSPRIERALAKESRMYYLFMFVTEDGQMPTIAIKWHGVGITSVYAYQRLLSAGILEVQDEIEHMDYMSLDDFSADEATHIMQEFYQELKEQSQ